MNIDPSTTKYMIKARLQADGIVEKPDVVGAIFGQTEGLLGDELDLRDLQKSGRIGRIEVEVGSKQGKSEGEILIPSSLDQVETVILASALETIDRVGPCKAQINTLSIEDVRISKRQKIIDRARDLLTELIKQSKTSGIDLTESVRQSVQIEEILNYGKERLPAGPNVHDSDAIIVVEGRSDVLNLLRSGIKNAIAVEGTNVPKSVVDLSKERVITAFVDGDRGGELILREMFQVAEVDFVARAPRGMEVEELTQKQIMKCLRNKIPGEQFMEMYGMTPNGRGAGREFNDVEPEKAERSHREPRERRESRPRQEREHREPRERRGPVHAYASNDAGPEPHEKPHDRNEGAERAAPSKQLSDVQITLKTMINDLGSTSKAKLLDANLGVIRELPVRELVNNLKVDAKNVATVVFDGIITQRILDIAADKKIGTIVGTKMGNITKQPASVEVWTRDDLN
ncbi:MAG: DNA primase [Euryarchaeota archaeon]|nr:DNA primase [Euryarchaeota archaeon]